MSLNLDKIKASPGNLWKELDISQESDGEIKAVEYVLSQQIDKNQSASQNSQLETIDYIYDSQRQLVYNQIDTLKEELHSNVENYQQKIICLNNMIIRKEQSQKLREAKKQKRMEQEQAIRDLEELLKKNMKRRSLFQDESQSKNQLMNKSQNSIRKSFDSRDKQQLTNQTSPIKSKTKFKINKDKITFGDRMRIMSNDKKMYYYFKLNRPQILQMDVKEKYEEETFQKLKDIKERHEQEQIEQKIQHKEKYLIKSWKDQKRHLNQQSQSINSGSIQNLSKLSELNQKLPIIISSPPQQKVIEKSKYESIIIQSDKTMALSGQSTQTISPFKNNSQKLKNDQNLKIKC
eukprot:403356210